MTYKSTLDELAGLSHVILGVEKASEIARALGMNPERLRFQKFVDTRNPITGKASDPKGVFLKSGPGTTTFGISSEELACQICKNVGVDYELRLGRGFQLQECVSSLREHFARRVS